MQGAGRFWSPSKWSANTQHSRAPTKRLSPAIHYSDAELFVANIVSALLVPRYRQFGSQNQVFSFINMRGKYWTCSLYKYCYITRKLFKKTLWDAHCSKERRAVPLMDSATYTLSSWNWPRQWMGRSARSAHPFFSHSSTSTTSANIPPSARNKDPPFIFSTNILANK